MPVTFDLDKVLCYYLVQMFLRSSTFVTGTLRPKIVFDGGMVLLAFYLFVFKETWIRDCDSTCVAILVYVHVLFMMHFNSHLHTP